MGIIAKLYPKKIIMLMKHFGFCCRSIGRLVFTSESLRLCLPSLSPQKYASFYLSQVSIETTTFAEMSKSSMQALNTVTVMANNDLRPDQLWKGQFIAWSIWILLQPRSPEVKAKKKKNFTRVIHIVSVDLSEERCGPCCLAHLNPYHQIFMNYGTVTNIW